MALNTIMKQAMRIFFPLGIRIKIDAGAQVVRVYNGEDEVKTLTFDEAEKEINEQFSTTSSNS